MLLYKDNNILNHHKEGSAKLISDNRYGTSLFFSRQLQKHPVEYQKKKGG